MFLTRFFGATRYFPVFLAFVMQTSILISWIFS